MAKQHKNCPKCGALNGPFEQLGNGLCNACLDKRVKRAQQRAKARKTDITQSQYQDMVRDFKSVVGVPETQNVATFFTAAIDSIADQQQKN